MNVQTATNTKTKGQRLARPWEGSKLRSKARARPASHLLASLRAENDQLRTCLQERTDMLGTVELHQRYLQLAVAVAQLATHPDYPKDYKSVMIWRTYSYVCGLAQLSDNNFRDEVVADYQRLPFGETAGRFAQALSDVLECGDLPSTVFDTLEDLANDIQDLLISSLSPSQRAALRLRLLLGPEAQAAFDAA